jgi:hypothetical protein
MNGLIGVSLASRLVALDTATRQIQQAPQSKLDALMSAAKEQVDQDRLGNFEIQDLMSSYNQAESVSKSSQLDSAAKDLEAQDRLGNFEIQRLMSQYNQAEQLASSIQRKQDDASADQIRKIG